MDGMYEDMEGMMDEDGEMMYGDEEGMDDHDGHHEMMGEGDSYGMEGSPGDYEDVRNTSLFINNHVGTRRIN